MKDLARHHGPMLATATAAGWWVASLICGALAEARLYSVLWTSFERLFLILAIFSAALAVALMVWRSTPGDTHWLTHLGRSALGPASLVVASCWIATSLLDVRIGLLLLGASLGSLIHLDGRLPPGGDGVHV